MLPETAHRHSKQPCHSLPPPYRHSSKQVCFFGGADEAPDFFARASLPIPDMWNPPDHYIEAVSEKASVALLLEAMRSDPVTNAIGSVGVSGGGGVGSVNGLGADTLAPSLASPSVSKTMAPLSYQVRRLSRIFGCTIAKLVPDQTWIFPYSATCTRLAF